jgi:hypothetical protein
MESIPDQDCLMALGTMRVLVCFVDNAIEAVYIGGHEVEPESFSDEQLITWHEDARIEHRKWEAMYGAEGCF